MTQICKMCGSEWDDIEYDHCTQCCGDVFESMDGEKIKFETPEEMSDLANGKQILGEKYQKDIKIQQENVFIENEKLNIIIDEYYNIHSDYIKLLKGIKNIKNQRKYLNDTIIKR